MTPQDQHPAPSGEPGPVPPPFTAGDRLRIRTGRLARSRREDPAALDPREPDELFDPILDCGGSTPPE